MHRMQSDDWPYLKVSDRDSLKVLSLHAAVLRAAVFHSTIVYVAIVIVMCYRFMRKCVHGCTRIEALEVPEVLMARPNLCV